MTEIVIRLSEAATNRLIDLLLAIGTSDPTDGCECIYVSIPGVVTLVFQLFA